MNKPLTGTALEKMRRYAKQQARTDAIPYGHALEQQARNAGFASWHEARKALRSIPSEPAGELPVDPPLPPQFDQTPNEQRSKAELDAWWLRPFAQARGDGSYDVRCLDGGAWDRPTYYGVAKDLDEARAIARAGLERWQKVRDTPAFLLLDGAVLLALEPNRPGMPRPVLFTGGTTDDAKRFLEQFEKLRETNPGAAALIIRAARDRSCRVPTYDEMEAVSKRAAANGLVAPDGSPASFRLIALLFTLHRMREPGEPVVQFTVAEAAHYMWELDVSSQDAEDLLPRLLQLEAGDQRVIADAHAEQRDGVANWRLRFGADRWLTGRRGGIPRV
jgi:hypothetical protein